MRIKWCKFDPAAGVVYCFCAFSSLFWRFSVWQSASLIWWTQVRCELEANGQFLQLTVKTGSHGSGICTVFSYFHGKFGFWWLRFSKSLGGN